jgi:hypothetical protein
MVKTKIILITVCIVLIASFTALSIGCNESTLQANDSKTPTSDEEAAPTFGSQALISENEPLPTFDVNNLLDEEAFFLN